MALFGKDWRPVFDTNIFTTYEAYLKKDDFRKMSLSIIVLYELTARPIADETFKKFDKWRETYENKNRLIVPTSDDIWTASKAIRNLRLAQQKQHKGITPTMKNATQFQNDAVIARSAFKNGCFVVTDNTKDFDALRKFMRFEYCSPKDYFGI